MMHSLHEGIVLKTHIPKKQKLIILDKKLGKIECVPSNVKALYSLSNGGYIKYLPKLWNRQYYSISDIQVLGMPFYWAKNNLLFFHHVLELCDYFLQFEDTSANIFDLIILLYFDPEKVKTIESKKLFLCNFFKCLGIYPDNPHSYNSVIFNLISGSLHSSLNNKYEISVSHDLKRWLVGCIKTHPQAHRLRTIEFLNAL